MATTSTSSKQATPAAQRDAIRATSETRIRALRLVQEKARMAFVESMKKLRATPKESPERAFRSNQFRQSKREYEAAKAAVVSAQTVLDITLDSMREEEAGLLRKAQRAAEAEAKRWGKSCRKARQPFDISLAAKVVKIRKQSIGVVYAPCGCGCADAATADAHARYCPECRRIAEEHELSFTQTGAVINPQEA
jgi:hypothetical protein